MQAAQWFEQPLSGASCSVVQAAQWRKLLSGASCSVVQAAQWCNLLSGASSFTDQLLDDLIILN